MKDQSGPPAARSHLWQRVNQTAAEGTLRLQVCKHCGKTQYPPQEFCSVCLSDDLSWEQVNPLGKTLSWTTSHASNNRFFKDRLPLHIGMIKLDCGPVMIAYLAASCLRAGSRTQISVYPDKSGQAVFLAAPPGSDPAPEFSNILIE